MGAQSNPAGNPFIPAAYNFVGAMDILAIVAYCTGFLGSVSFMKFSLFAYQSEKERSERSAGYYRSRMHLDLF
jgi:hypothetical protein